MLRIWRREPRSIHEDNILGHLRRGVKEIDGRVLQQLIVLERIQLKLDFFAFGSEGDGLILSRAEEDLIEGGGRRARSDLQHLAIGQRIDETRLTCTELPDEREDKLS